MHFDRNPLHPVLQDKLALKKYAAERGIRSAEVFFETNEPGTIPFDLLPEKCFIKANHGCNWNILKYGEAFYDFRNGEEVVTPAGIYSIDLPAAKRLVPDEVAALCTQWLSQRYRPVEWAYNHIKPMIFGEKIIEPFPDRETMDFRLYTFRGRVAAISIGSPSMRMRDENVFFDPQWNKISLRDNFEKEPSILPEKPPFLDEMMVAAKKIGNCLDFLRIDFFADSQRSYLSEVTIYPNGGQDSKPTSDDRFNLFLGDQWRMTFRQWWQAWRLEMRHRKEKPLKAGI